MNTSETVPPKERILHAAAELLAAQGRDAVTSRAVSAKAEVQPQTIYRQYGDMQGLLNAVARHGFASYLARKTSHGPEQTDPIAAFRIGWNMHNEFATENPALYALMYGEPRPGIEAATGDIEAVLASVLHRVALAGKLTVSVEKATRMVLAANVGTALALIENQTRAAPDTHDFSHDMCEMVISTIMDESATASSKPTVATTTAAVAAASLGAALPSVKDQFSAGEFILISELLARIG